MFLHSSSTRLRSDVERLNIRTLVCEESIIRECVAALDDVTIRDDRLSSKSSFKYYKILERRNSSRGQFSEGEDVAFIAFSSGSTGHPKIIRVPFGSIMPNIVDLRYLSPRSSNSLCTHSNYLFPQSLQEYL